MKYITDTDFLPGYTEIHYDSYQLLYGVIVNHQEGKIYDTIISLCRKYREPILRMSKIDYWQHIVDKVIEQLQAYVETDDNIMVYIPYLNLMCSPDMLLQRYSYARMVLENVRGVQMGNLIRRNNWTFNDIRHFFPIKKLEDLMCDAIPNLAKTHNKEESKMREIIEGELIRRGIRKKDENSSFCEDNSYVKTLFKGEYLKNIQTKLESEDDVEQYTDKGNKVETVGFLYYALDHYFNKLRKQKKETHKQLLNDATYTIANGLFSPSEKLNRKLMSKDTEYQYIQKKTFNNQNTKLDTLKEIKTILENCGIVVPKEISDHFSNN